MAADPDPLSPQDDPGEILWRGRPALGVCVPDLNAALAGFGLAVIALTTVLTLASPDQARLGVIYAIVVGLATLAGRVVGAGFSLTVLTIFFTVLSVASLVTSREGVQLVCPLMMSGALFGVLVMKFQQQRAKRYQVTAKRATMGERGRYTVAFAIEGRPVIKPDWFGKSLGTVDFGQVAATLTTQDGNVFKFPPQPRVFKRVKHPQRLLEALGHAPDED